MGKSFSAVFRSLNEKAKEILREVGVFGGPYSHSILNIIRSYLQDGYNPTDIVASVKCSKPYIARMAALKNGEDRKQRLRAFGMLDVSVSYQNSSFELANHIVRISQYKAKKAAYAEEARQRRTSTMRVLARCNTREKRLMAFGILEVVELDSCSIPDSALAKHIKYINQRKIDDSKIALHQRRNAFINTLLINSKHLTERTVLQDSKLPDQDAPLSELVRRYIPGGKAAEFRAFLSKNTLSSSPLTLVESFLGHKVHQQESLPRIASTEAIAAIESRAPKIATTEKREGNITSVVTRPDQATFSEAVRYNCYGCCVITGATLRQRTEAAHLVEHQRTGIDHFTNGLLMRRDIHSLFDDGVIGIDPTTLIVYVQMEALIEDPDLIQYHSKPIAATRQSINRKNLLDRWETFHLPTKSITPENHTKLTNKDLIVKHLK
ncbi:HNH endonuclease [Salmonella bongori]|uniref:HNH endonuclease signature motif containing protein n=1 Tax=Salmonella bongori TaxID=54736 RepID=UPI001281EBD7|nr:HNH endonuclease signature motif containing protein [Salmonella bongori]ECG8257832.1 HNH endonuclease [Salmonella bongori serovar 48:i:-]ECG9252983.1 HNH endonuclease [Salmonella bongori]EDP8706216.1 HNH endonuclease [Salmonella bongori]EDP8726102.1 HNH endonuclease [Salmonella bongori]EEO9370562.1 HNH endonuclease [Salmonella bongori]